MATISDNKQEFYKTFGLSGSDVDMDWIYYSTRSGLTPVERYPLALHKRNYFKAQLSLSDAVVASLSVSDLERQFLDPTNVKPTKAFNDLLNDFYINPTNIVVAKAVEVGVDTVSNANLWDSGGTYGAIVFKTRAVVLNIAKVKIRTGNLGFGAPTGNIEIGIAPLSGITLGAAPSVSNPTLLAKTTAVSAASLSANTWYEWALNTSIQLSANTKYALVVVTGGNCDRLGSGYNQNSATEQGIDVDQSTADYTLYTGGGVWAVNGSNIFPFELKS